MTTMIQIFLLLHLLRILALHTFARSPTPSTTTMAVTIVLQTVTLLTPAFGAVLAGADQKQLLLVAATHALALTRAGQPLLEALAVVLLAAGFAAQALPHYSLGLSTGLVR